MARKHKFIPSQQTRRMDEKDGEAGEAGEVSVNGKKKENRGKEKHTSEVFLTMTLFQTLTFKFVIFIRLTSIFVA